MVRIRTSILNNINQDLQFTAETPAEFGNKRLPTLDFSIWLEKNGEINHSYFQKEMKTPYVIMKRSAMSQHSKVSILSNEIVRRLSNINHKMIPTKEIEEVVEVFICEMKTSGYERAETKEIVVSGITGWQRKMKRREEEGRIYNRSARSTLSIRCRNKLLEKTSWYKAKRKREGEEMGERMEKEKAMERKRE